MEYANDAAAQAAYVSSDAATYTSQYPPAHSDTYVKATTYYNSDYYPYFATDPAKSLTGNAALDTWLSGDGQITNQRFHIDLGSGKIIKRIYYENQHNNGSDTARAVKNFTFWGSNTGAGSFDDLVYANDEGWTELTVATNVMLEHVAADQADPQYIVVTNTTAYRYYAFKFADSYAASFYYGIRRVELQTVPLQDYSESSVKQQGSYSLKGVAVETISLNETLTRTVSPTIDLTDKTQIKFDIRAGRTGSNIKVGIHDSGGVTTEITPNIDSADTFQTVSWDISGVGNANKDAIDSIIITIVNADAANTFYIDNMYAESQVVYYARR